MQTLSLENWFKQFKQTSDDVSAYWADHVQNDICGWAGIIRESWRSGTQPLLAGVLLMGEAGTGRHNTALHLAADRGANFNHAVYFATGDDLWSDTDSFAVVHERLERLLCADDDEGAVLVLEQWENHPFTGQMLNQLSQLLCQFRLGADRDADILPVFVILIADGEPAIPALLRGLIRTCRLNLPDVDQREDFLARQPLAGELEELVDLRELAEKTIGYSYGQLADLVVSLHDYHETRSIARNTDLAGFVRRQSGLSEQQDAERELMLKLDAYLSAVPEKLDKLDKLDRLDRLDSIQIAAGGWTTAPSQTADANSGSDMPHQYSSKELSDLRVRELINVGFDDDIAKALLSAAVPQAPD